MKNKLIINKIHINRGNYEYVCKNFLTDNYIFINSDNINKNNFINYLINITEVHIHNSYFLTKDILNNIRQYNNKIKIVLYYHDDYDYIYNFKKEFIEVSNFVDKVYCSNKYSLNKIRNENKYLLKYYINNVSEKQLNNKNINYNVFWVGDTNSKNKHIEYIFELADLLPKHNFIIIDSNSKELKIRNKNIKRFNNILPNNEIYNLCDLHILTSKYEGASLSSLEMSKRGVPTISFNNHIDLKIHDKVDFGDINNMKNKIIKYFDDDIYKLDYKRFINNYNFYLKDF